MDLINLAIYNAGRTIDNFIKSAIPNISIGLGQPPQPPQRVLSAKEQLIAMYPMYAKEIGNMRPEEVSYKLQKGLEHEQAEKLEAVYAKEHAEMVHNRKAQAEQLFTNMTAESAPLVEHASNPDKSMPVKFRVKFNV